MSSGDLALRWPLKAISDRLREMQFPLVKQEMQRCAAPGCSVAFEKRLSGPGRGKKFCSMRCLKRSHRRLFRLRNPEKAREQNRRYAAKCRAANPEKNRELKRSYALKRSKNRRAAKRLAAMRHTIKALTEIVENG